CPYKFPLTLRTSRGPQGQPYLPRPSPAGKSREKDRLLYLGFQRGAEEPCVRPVGREHQPPLRVAEKLDVGMQVETDRHPVVSPNRLVPRRQETVPSGQKVAAAGKHELAFMQDAEALRVAVVTSNESLLPVLVQPPAGYMARSACQRCSDQAADACGMIETRR